jgi:hypothetical protein
MANTAKNDEHVNGFGMTNDEIQKLVDQKKKWDLKNARNKVANRILKEKIKAAGITVTEKEIDEAIAQG